MTAQLPPAPQGYVANVWQQILNAVGSALGRCFQPGKDLRLINGERFSLQSPNKTEVFIGVDNAGVLSQIAQLGAETIVSSASTLTLNPSGHYVFTGTTATWTLAAIAGNTNKGVWIKNRGSGNITLNGPAASTIYTTSAVSSITITPGSSAKLMNDGTYWESE